MRHSNHRPLVSHAIEHIERKFAIGPTKNRAHVVTSFVSETHVVTLVYRSY